MSGKKYKEAFLKVTKGKVYSLANAAELLKEVSYTKFDSTVEVAVNLGVDPRHADQNVRGALVLPHGLGKKIRVVVFAKGEKIKEALEAGAIEAGAEELIQKIQGGWLDFDASVATPDMMGLVGRLGKTLAPRGLMPNPKVGTVTLNVKQAVADAMAGRVEFKVTKTGIVHCPVGKVSFTPSAIEENIRSFVDVILRARPVSVKGSYVKSIYLASSMSPSICIDIGQFR
jgi:large subunit ribosomal protein L1